MAEDTEVEKENKDFMDPETRARVNLNLVKATPFQKGKSGNPKGRPKRARTMTDHLRKEGERKVKITLGNEKYEGTNYEVLSKRIWRKSITKVDSRLIDGLLDRIEGRPVSALELRGRDGKPIELIVKYDGNNRTE